MKKNLLISIVVPVYNVEKYLDQCIQSILKQPYTDFELILINDGSTDNSLSICQKYASQDARIVLISQDNAGVSSARNVGIDIAKGDYIWFIDSDDFIVNNALEVILKKISKSNEVDIIGINNYHLFEDGSLKENFIAPSLDVMDKKSFYNQGYFLEFTPWINIYRRRFLIENHIYFNRELLVFEDNYFTNECLSYAKSIAYIEDYLYVYRRLENSLTALSKNISIRNKGLLILYNQIETKIATDKNLINYWADKQYSLALLLVKNNIQVKSKLVIINNEFWKVKIIKVLYNINPSLLCFFKIVK